MSSRTINGKVVSKTSKVMKINYTFYQNPTKHYFTAEISPKTETTSINFAELNKKDKYQGRI